MAFPPCLEVLKQVQHHVVCTLCTPLLLGDRRLLPHHARNNDLTFINASMRLISSLLKKRAFSSFAWDNSHKFKVHKLVRFATKEVPMSKEPHHLPNVYLCNWPTMVKLFVHCIVHEWEDVMGLSHHHFPIQPLHKLSNPF